MNLSEDEEKLENISIFVLEVGCLAQLLSKFLETILKLCSVREGFIQSARYEKSIPKIQLRLRLV